MRRHYEDLHQSLQESLAGIKKGEEGIAWIEACFQQAIVHWERLKERVLKDGFDSEADEIYFFKKTKHLFTAEIEYYSLLYYAHIFNPGNDTRERITFCQQEGIRLCQFIHKHGDFYDYLKTGRTDKDAIYFLKKNLWRQPPVLVKSGQHDYRLTTSHEYLVSLFIALERYDIFIKELAKEWSG